MYVRLSHLLMSFLSNLYLVGLGKKVYKVVPYSITSVCLGRVAKMDGPMNNSVLETKTAVNPPDDNRRRLMTDRF